MLTFNITAPDGKTYRVTGDSQEGALSALQQHIGNPSPTAPQPPSSSSTHYDMGQLETALRNADAAGDTPAAQMLADQIRQQRAILSRQSTNPVQVRGPDGSIIEFPAGTGEDVMQSALRKHYNFDGQAGAVPDDIRAGAQRELNRRGAAAELERRQSMNMVGGFPTQKTSRSGQPADGFPPMGANGAKPQRYEVEIQGQRFELEAPDEAAARTAVRKMAEEMGAGGHMTFEQGQALLEEEERQKRAQGASGTVGAGLSGFIDGMPVVGPMLLGGAQRAAAGIASMFDNDGYDENLRQAQSVTEAAQQNHPYVTTGANVAGSVAGTAPLIAAAPAAFGARSGSLAMRSTASMLSGAILGGSDAAVRSGGNADDTAVGAGIGAGMGFIGPAAGKLIGAGAQKVWNTFANREAAAAAGVKPRVVRGLADLAARDGLDANAMRSAMDDLGTEAMLMDLGPGLQGRAGGIAATPGRGQSIIRDALMARQEGANARLGQVVDDTLGPNVVPSQIDAAITGNQRSFGPLYEEAFRGARAVDTRPIAEGLEAQAVNLRGDAQRAVGRVREMLDITGAPGNLDPNPGTLFQTRQAIDGMLSTEANPQVIRVLTGARSQIDDELARTVPNLKEVDANFAELARQREALTRGQSVLDGGRTSPRPNELIDEVQAGIQPQGMQIGPSAVPLRLSQGARAEVDRILGNNANDIAALNRIIRTEGDWNRSRLSTLFGQDKADRLFRALESERVFADTNQVVTRNSETARRQMAIGEGRNTDPDLVRQAAAYGGMTAVPRAIAIKAADKIFNALVSGRKGAFETELASGLSSKNRAIIEALRVRDSLPTTDPKVEAIAKALLLGGSIAGSR